MRKIILVVASGVALGTATTTTARWPNTGAVAEAADPVLAEDTSAESRTSMAASVDTSSSTGTLIAALPSAAVASSPQVLASSQRGRIGRTTIGTTVACHGGSGRLPVGASAYADPFHAISLAPTCLAGFNECDNDRAITDLTSPTAASHSPLQTA